MSINEIVLFVSVASQNCMQVIEAVRRSNLPIKIVRLDTQEAREKALNGKLFQVKHVPTMVIRYDDGNIQQFIGVEKVSKIITSLVQQQNPPEPPPPTPIEDVEDEPSPKKKKKTTKKKTRKPKDIPEQISDLDFTFAKDTKRKGKQQSTVIDDSIEYEEEGDVMYLDTEEDESPKTYKAMKRPPMTKTDALISGGNTNNPSMRDTMNDAERMRKEWEERQKSMDEDYGEE